MKHLTQHQIVRYIVGGGTSAFLNLAMLWFFNSIEHVHYLLAETYAFFIAFGVSLLFHKYWTFRDHRIENLHTQGLLYLGTSCFGLAVNTSILYYTVSIMGIPVLPGQVIAGGLTACVTFFISKHLVFKKQKTDEEIIEEFL